MLFYPRKQPKQEFLLKLKVLGISVAGHLILFILIFVGTLFKSDPQSIVFDVKSKFKPGAIVHFGKKNMMGRATNIKNKNNKTIKQVSPKVEAPEKVVKKIEKKILEKNNKINNKIKEKVIEKKSEPEKLEKADPEIKKTEEPEKTVKEEPYSADESAMKGRHECLKEEKVEAIEKTEPEEQIADMQTLDISEDYDQNSLSMTDQIIFDSIRSNFNNPPGFQNHEPFKITFEIDIDGKVRNISKIGSEPLVLYTAIKQAILKATYPVKRWGSKIELIVR